MSGAKAAIVLTVALAGFAAPLVVVATAPTGAAAATPAAQGPPQRQCFPIFDPCESDSPTPAPSSDDPGSPTGPDSSTPAPSAVATSSAAPEPVVAPPLVHGTRLSLSKPTTSHGKTTLSGTLDALDSGAGVAGQRMTVLLQDRLKHTTTHTVTTNNAGRATLTITPQVITSLTMSFSGGSGYTPSSRSTTVVVPAPQDCHVTKHAVAGSTTLVGTCTEAHLPKGTKLQLQYLRGNKWITAATGKSKTATLHFTLALARAGTYRTRVLLAANQLYGITALSLPDVRVS